MIHNRPGTYMLLLKLPEHMDLEAGRNLSVHLKPGIYAYIGSALGPGGLTARLRRHASMPERKHWHIDYLMPHAHLMGALVIQDEQRLECTWVAWTAQHARSCINGFGASDCRCNGHLFFFGGDTDPNRFIRKARKHLHALFISKPHDIGKPLNIR